MFDTTTLTRRMAANAGAIRALAEGVDREQARWRPEEGQWSLLETICHLADEERDDFRTRLDLTLHRPGEPWPLIDPDGWVESREYNERDLETSLADFLRERETSIAWLSQLTAPDWTAAHEHPRIGPIEAGTLMASWLAHDQLHLRQLAGLHFAWTTATAEPFVTLYAGEW